jgi:hypothetical protein
MFADDVTVSKPMIKYACGIPKESIVDFEAKVAVPENPIESCSQKQVGQAPLLRLEHGLSLSIAARHGGAESGTVF